MNVVEIFETMEYGPAPEAAAPGLAWIKDHSPFSLFINNQWIKPASGQYLDSINPATGKPLAKVAAANSVDVDAAVTAARAAFKTWAKRQDMYAHASCTPLLATSRNTRACWLYWNRLITANQSAKRVTLTYRLLPVISTITLAGRN